MKLLQKITKNKTYYLALIVVLIVLSFTNRFADADVLTAGYCWNENTGWIDISNVDLDLDTRQFSGLASFHKGNHVAGAFSDGEIDFTNQDGTSLNVTLSGDQNGDGNLAILGRAFSEQIGWVLADHGGGLGTEAAITPAGELTGNFWSNEFGWIHCDEATVGESNVQVWEVGSEFSSNDSSSRRKSKKKPLDWIKNIFSQKKEEPVAPVVVIPEKTEDVLGGGELCPANQTLTQNLKAPSTNGQYHSYTRSVVTEAKILQAHINRLGFNSGPEDGIIGPLTDGAIKRMQVFLGAIPDGYVGPNTRQLINNSCGLIQDTTEDVDIVKNIPIVSVNIACSFDINAKPGDEGSHVLKIQNFLKNEGLFTAEPNGYYGPATSQAVKDFQDVHPSIYLNAGLTQSTDWFYTSTRKKASDICENKKY